MSAGTLRALIKSDAKAFGAPIHTAVTAHVPVNDPCVDLETDNCVQPADLRTIRSEA